jgi:uncharacterized Fe-S cluster-containing radical SAM superfamily protein
LNQTSDPLGIAFDSYSGFDTLDTASPEGPDCTPRIGPAGFVCVVDERTITLPDRPGADSRLAIGHLPALVSLLWGCYVVSATIRNGFMAEVSVAGTAKSGYIIASDADSAHHLVSALDACARLDIYWSNEFFYRWLNSAPGGKWKIFPLRPRDTRIDVGGCDVVVRVQGKAPDRLVSLERLAADDRFPGAAVALTRWLARAGRHEEGLATTRNALAGIEGSRLAWDFHILQNQITALERKIAGEPVHRAIQRYLGDDDGFMSSRTCENPFERLDLQENGNATVCCAQWMPNFSLGNVISGNETAAQIYNNDRAVAVRRSVLDGSFRYCDHDKCGRIPAEELPVKAEVPYPNAKRAVETGELTFESPSTILLAFDQSCNLSCPSCRTHVITEKIGLQETKEQLIETSILPMLKGARTLNINPAGELFVSRPLRRLLSRLNSTSFPGLKLELITNGTLFNRREWERYPGIHDMIATVRISTDGATKETFEKLRRGANWETFIENMRFLAELRESGAFLQIHFSFTYQKDNFREMPLFVDVTHDIDPHRLVIFEKLDNWGAFTPEEYLDKAVHRLDHPLHQEFLSVIRQPKLKSVPFVLRADYEGLL